MDKLGDKNTALYMTKYFVLQSDLRKLAKEMRAVTDIGKHGAGVTASQMWADKIDKLLEEGE